MNANEVIAIGARSRAEASKPALQRRGGGIQIPLQVRPCPGGGADLVDERGRVVSPCASVEVAERTKAFFQ